MSPLLGPPLGCEAPPEQIGRLCERTSGFVLCSPLFLRTREVGTSPFGVGLAFWEWIKPLAQSDSRADRHTLLEPRTHPKLACYCYTYVLFIHSGFFCFCFFPNAGKHSSDINCLGCVEPPSVAQRVVSALVWLSLYPSFSLLPPSSYVLGLVVLRGLTWSSAPSHPRAPWLLAVSAFSSFWWPSKQWPLTAQWARCFSISCC